MYVNSCIFSSLEVVSINSLADSKNLIISAKDTKGSIFTFYFSATPNNKRYVEHIKPGMKVHIFATLKVNKTGNNILRAKRIVVDSSYTIFSLGFLVVKEVRKLKDISQWVIVARCEDLEMDYTFYLTSTELNDRIVAELAPNEKIVVYGAVKVNKYNQIVLRANQIVHENNVYSLDADLLDE